MEAGDSNYPMQFGVSCALLAFHLASRPTRPVLDKCRRSHTTELMYQSRIHLLGILLVKAKDHENELHERLERSEKEVEELKKRRTEDAKANEKVASIFAAHEQRWIAEKKSLQRQLQLLINEMCALKSRHEEAMSDMKRRLDEEQRAIGFKDQALEQEMKKCREAEEKLKLAEQVMSELREKAQKEEQDHMVEIWKHKTAFVELMSNQRRLEAELARTVRQADVSKRELEQATTTVDELSSEVVRLKKDVEQKDKVLTAMLRKSKIDTADKQMLLKEIKVTKARKKQAELEAERWRKMWQSQRHGSRKGVLKGSLRYYGEAGGSSKSTITELEMEGRGFERKKQHLADYFEAENRMERELEVEIEESSVTCVECIDRYPSYIADKPASEEFHQLQDWIRMEAEKFASLLEKQHNAEIEAFTEQMRLKDERLESFKWRLLSTEIEKKRIQCQIEGLNRDLQHYQDESSRLQAILSDKNEELDSLKEHLICHASANIESTKEIESESEKRSEITYKESTQEIVSPPTSATDTCLSESPLNVQVVQEIEEEKEVTMDTGTGFTEANICPEEVSETSLPRKDLPWKNDILALGVSYKIKRLKQQLIVLEKLAGVRADKKPVDEGTSDKTCDDARPKSKGYESALLLVNKQVKRYQSLEGKIDDLCSRMEEIDRGGRRNDPDKGMTSDETEKLEQFLEETFQLQRYMVATGQKLLEIQSKINSSFSGKKETGLDKKVGLNLAQFGEIVKSLFRDVQRGLEVRIARIIGDLEGTLASDGILQR
ncbi:Ribonuclease P protein subunit P38-like protein [Rhynchospora pubera]|uniref:Ribonuclease P protein subunit P38-like protein n=1 Tax=Rhynchospora pubera TaxID=906938 RepID=A0AAV8DP23_9POAL|nr:Ribonuclease P protein subunit P38-like protein [Rhynchospora pubera]